MMILSAYTLLYASTIIHLSFEYVLYVLYIRRGAATAAAIISSTNSNTNARALQLQSAARSNRGKYIDI